MREAESLRNGLTSRDGTDRMSLAEFILAQMLVVIFGFWISNAIRNPAD